MAVGSYYKNTSVTETLAESWNGKRWSIVPTPSLAGQGSALAASRAPAPPSASLSGKTAWRLSSSPERNQVVSPREPQPGFDDVLTGVACTSSTHCVAVGYDEKGSGAYDTLVESWNGTTWSVVPSPNPSKSFNFVLAVSCASSSSCMAVGQEENGSDWLNLAETFNGSKWKVATTPNPSSSYNELERRGL